MPCSVAYLEDSKVVQLSFSGHVPPDDLLKAVEAGLAEARARGTERFLADCRELEGGHSVIDLYQLGQILEHSGLSRRCREAVLLPLNSGMKSDAAFWETTAQNRGYRVCILPDLPAALAWLRAGE